MKSPKDVTILVVDDEPDICELIASDFEDRGFKTRMASNGKLAFEIIQSERVDVVISDIRMPGGNGIDLLDRIKARDPEIPVVLLITGFSDLTLDEAYARGADAIFHKPFDRKELLAAALRAITPRIEQWSQRLDRLEVNFEIELQLPGLDSAIQSKILNIGRGGMFVALVDHFPKVGDITSFRITLNQGTPSVLEGTGITRWVRSKNEGDLRSGVGIEFYHLEDSCKKALVDLIDSLRTKCFIPKH